MPDQSSRPASGPLVCIRAPAVVIGCLTPRMLRVIVHPHQGMGNIMVDLPLWLVPLQLRMPNTRFDVLLDMEHLNYVAALPTGEVSRDERFREITFEEWIKFQRRQIEN